MRVSIDSRTIQPGDTFIPIKGETHDGHDFIKEALNKGARVLDVDIADYARKYRKKLNCHVIGITGSAGKTTVKDMLAALLAQKYKVVKTQENQNNEIGAPLTILQADANTDIIIVEMGMRKKGDLSYLSKIVRPTHVVVTGVGLTHIEYFKNQKALALAKAEIFGKLLKSSQKDRYAFINFQSPHYQLLKRKAEKENFLLFPYQGSDKPDQNMNLCYEVGRHFNLNQEEIQKGLANYRASSHRLNVINLKSITIVDDTYNSNPDGVIFALQYIQRFTGRKILVLGDMLELGKYAAQEHQKIVEYAINANISLMYTYGQETSFITSNELPIYNFKDKETLHKNLTTEIKPGDILLIKGSRSLKMEETVEFLKHQYD